MKTAAAYYRTSSATNVGGDKDSEKRQRDAVEAYAKSSGIKIVDSFYDAAVSGDDDLATREGFAEMLDCIEGNGVRTVLIESADRLARKVLVQEVGIIALQERGVQCITSSGLDLTDDTDEFKVAMRQVAGVFAQLEKARLVRKLKGARDRKSKAPGKRIEGRKAWAELDPELVRQAKRLHRRNPRTGKRRSLRRISKELDVLGYRNSKGKPFAAASVQRMVAG